ncbi:manganese and iron superoxide dismutase [Tilletiaria anomala UBC 951]|uniref:Manganese and iron superoxide dismutase n=1 Tax=Tilletiaria anomala (strain ATCC 24038 / CBS 436.72 / UBC 951) TaxID=1037660 RepID=A0A066WPZ5_TILAU|nr:manganese and iron superoxide dismutase [Tilletiaria anomala UBC 951]KDN53079.1 manganese and iron superoxide dismutase [Tilletiaria anomala UBC 951]
MSCIASTSRQQLVGLASRSAKRGVAGWSRDFSSAAVAAPASTSHSSLGSSCLRCSPTQASTPHTWGSRRSLHSLPPLPQAIADEQTGCKPFLGPVALQLIGNVWHGGLLQRLNDEVRGTSFETSSVVDTVIATSQDRSLILAFNFASQALNNAFFLSNLRPANPSKPSPLPPKSLLSRIEQDFDSLPAFKSAFSAAAMGMVSSGWVWLVRDQTGRLGIVPTFGAGTVLVQDRLQMGSADFQASIEESVRRANSKNEASAESASQSIQHPQPSSPSTPQSSFVPITGASSISLKLNKTDLRTDGAREKSKIGEQLTPLLCVSVHEHSWLPDYGIWGKEPYLMNFWECVDWEKVGKAYDVYAGNK